MWELLTSVCFLFDLASPLASCVCYSLLFCWSCVVNLSRCLVSNFPSFCCFSDPIPVFCSVASFCYSCRCHNLNFFVVASLPTSTNIMLLLTLSTILSIYFLNKCQLFPLSRQNPKQTEPYSRYYLIRLLSLIVF